MGRHLGVSPIDLRLVEAGFDDSDLGVVRLLCPPRLCGEFAANI
jgi:hypothetical protein